MGMTLTTLSFLRFDVAAVSAQTEPTDLVRECNAPWLTLVPGEKFAIDSVLRLEKLAKSLTKQSDGAALHFYYFDDESFWCSVYQGGKKVASCNSATSWAKLGKKLDELFGDNLASTVFRLATKCSGLKEQLALLEEAVGAALYDVSDVEPRQVIRGKQTACAIMDRETALSKRKNEYQLAELPFSQWPKEYQRCRKAFDRMLADPNPDLLMTASDCLPNYFIVPGSDRLVQFYPMGEVILYDEVKDQVSWFTTPDAIPSHIIGMSKNGEYLALSFSHRRYVDCLQSIRADGTECWRFAPELIDGQELSHIHTSHEDVLTIFAKCVGADGHIWQLNSQTGAIIRTARIPYEKTVHQVAYVPAQNGFVYQERSTGDLILLNDMLEPVQRIADYAGSYLIEEKNLCGRFLWDELGGKSLCITDLLTGESRTVTLEVKSTLLKMLPDGRFLGTNEQRNKLLVYDCDGKMIARLPFKGLISHVFMMGDRVCAAELRFPKQTSIQGLLEPQPYEASIHLWTLESAKD